MKDNYEVNDSKKLISIIQEKYNHMSKGQKIIAKYIIDNYDKVAFMTASKLGESVGVSESTVVRFANALGYSGYPKLQDGLQELIKNKLTTVQRVEIANQSFSESDSIIRKIIKEDVDNTRETMETINEESFDRAVDYIINARKVYILGMRSSIYVAKYLGYYMNYILDNVAVIRMDQGEPFEQMLRMSERDVLIVISFPRYSKKSLQVTQFAKERNAKVISMTDSLFAPTAVISDESIIVKNNMVAFIDSLVPAFSASNALVVGIAMKQKEDITQYFDELENIWKKYHVYEQLEER